MAESNTPDSAGAGRSGWLSLLPLAFFLLAYLGGSAVLGDFYKIPMTVAFIASSCIAVAVSRGSLTKRIERFSAGAGHRSILLMVWIYVLAGAFAYTAQEIGAVDATVGLILRALPSSMVYVALFVAAAFVSLAIGTSVGTVVALVPIAAGMAAQMGQSPAELAALVVGGAYFGDNLSFISDTTIAATQTQEVKMDDKFKVNIRIVWPAIVVMLVYCIAMGVGSDVEPYEGPVRFAYVLPYAVVVGLAIWGINVMLVLLVGILAAGVVGMVGGDLDFWGFLGDMGQGVTSMGDLIVVAMLAGGMLELIRANGGLRLIMGLLQKGIRGPRGAQASIAALVGLANICTANNTVAIITVGRIAKDISLRFGVDPRRTASILDTVSCCVQGVLPYGVQMLLAAKLAGCSPLDILPHLYYPILIGLCVAVSIVTRRPRLGAN
ncbi:Na+/H+ antiporter NhaC family protein [Salmonella enterica]|nr:Na+/H+ antiporter NhaC family protein [Salmonella enterica]